jgi:predicted  nucleic acid-binding Zn-ribbon protein
MEKEDLEAKFNEYEQRLKEIERRLKPKPSKISTMKVSDELKLALNEFKVTQEESFGAVIWRIIYENQELFLENEALNKKAEKLEERNEELKDENKRLEKLEDGMRKEIAKLKGK